MFHIAVNFHYVGMPRMPYPGIHSLDTDEFSEYLNQLAKRFEFISLRQLINALNGRDLPERSCMITFDDGLRCQYENALPVLDKYGIPATFFVCGQPYSEHRGLTVHKLHLVRATLGDSLIYRKLAMFTEKKGMQPPGKDPCVKKALQRYRYDKPEAARLKYYLNYCTTRDFAQSFMRFLLETMDIGKKDFVEQTYMNTDMITDLGRRDAVGAHTMSHVPLGRLSKKEMSEELSASRIMLKQMTEREISAMSYPFGNVDAVNRKTAQSAAECGYRAAYTMERARNSNLSEPLLLGRIDAQDLNSIDNLPERSLWTGTAAN